MTFAHSSIFEFGDGVRASPYIAITEDVCVSVKSGPLSSIKTIEKKYSDHSKATAVFNS